ncbi:MAG TPA: hypothetical protein VMC62_05580 [Longilinea sp.]|nr:hypothetical protein [Longilinea sp.]
MKIKSEATAAVAMLAMAALLLAACNGSQTATPAGQVATQQLPAVQSALDEVSIELGAPQTQLTVVSVKATDWPDACLGVAQPQEVCAQGVVHGYQVILSNQGEQIEVHTDATGASVRVVKAETNLPAGVVKAQQLLAQALNLDSSQVKVVNATSVEWSDACLEVQTTGATCAQVQTPGYKVALEAQGRSYEYHTDESGSQVVLAVAPALQIGTPALVWQSSTQPCQEVQASLFGVGFGTCGGAMIQKMFVNGNRAVELTAFTATYKSFQASTPAGTVDFTGQGSQTAGTAEERSFAEWASMIDQETLGGNSGTDWGLAFSWQRQGGIAALCDDLSVYLSGWAYPGSCALGTSTSQGTFRLSETQLEELYGLVDRLQPVTIHQSDNATADSMTVDLTFNGSGKASASDTDKQTLLDFAGQLFASKGK